MVDHNENSAHAVALSFSDASFWCYSCDSYIISPILAEIARKLGRVKFPEDQENENSKLNSIPEDSEPDECLSFSYEELVVGLKDRKFSRVVFLTGAGISVAAGIPDFRTPGTGLYSKVQELGLPYPEAIFSLDYFKSTPGPFFKLANVFLTYQANPVKSHYFIKRLSDEGQLLMNFTQNIDGLELDAGLPQEKLLQAHGHMRSARCCECRMEVSISEFYAYVSREEIFYCPNCEGQGIVKPDIVFFGESLPNDFVTTMTTVTEADLVFVMGTSLKVYPFAHLLSLVKTGVPIVLVNREDPGQLDNASNVLFLQGDIEERIGALAQDLGWDLPAVISPAAAGDDQPTLSLPGDKVISEDKV
mmetsp:Transcript_19977/g.33455  ORF Transcript_19977/g.33455 Transcript_19977/m.33455 type:complete len:361 (+) Transcript_19977:311-1393(+)|eukprot:CAMPEP_0174968148 /NCGR_PEP_ID=MMETSP0004_2-20121128/7967_1 /TAXON_ID=420556 /ORGANISM="Ochromonas sp., Strain CCMP1393" /LENGTH=360 /DNA_ID=CAMNT_0016217337 /DNA_START=322 /DNA_END=1404 /DNA_ORIENTATION=+